MSSGGQTTTATTPIMEKASMSTTNLSRQAIEGELTKIGVTVEHFKSLTVDQLSDLLFGLNKVAISGSNGLERTMRARSKEDGGVVESVVLSQIDKKILKALLESKGSPSSIGFSRELDIPLSTVQRRRKRLEEECVRESYSLRYERFSRRNVTFIISLGAGDKSTIANEILGIEKVTQLSRTFGDGADLKAESIVETNKELMEISEKIKTIPRILKICWFESLEILGKKTDIDISIVESV
jgi:DNA-binding Lrp family transcriptional regulator